MTEKKPRRAKFTKEYKLEACKLVIEKGQKVVDTARGMGVDQVTLSRWVREYRKQGKEAFPGEGRLPETDAKIRALEAEVRRLKLEAEILKKAMAYFVDRPK
jgi:transposase